METYNKQISAQMSAAWDERTKHENFMALINQVKGYFQECSCDYGHGSYWRVNTLPIETLREILNRGNHEEILHLIHRYGASCPPEHFTYACAACHPYKTTDHILPEEIQGMIARRGNRTEIDAYLSYQGFGAAGQDAILERGDHNEIMRYLSRHGLLLEQQRKLKSRGNQEEWQLHISKHGLAPELIDEIFDKIEAGGSYAEYDEFISRHELPVAQQVRMLKTVNQAAFFSYIERYGLWEDAHGALVNFRSEEELSRYIKRHRYLSFSGEAKLARKGSHALNMLYINKRVCRERDSINYFWQKLLTVRPLDYEAIGSCFLKLDYTEFFSEYGFAERETEPEDIKLMKNGSHVEVMTRIAGAPLGLKALAELFFRNNPEEFEAYLDSHKKA